MLTPVTITEAIHAKSNEIRARRGPFFPGYSCSCPMALALAEATGRLWSVANLYAQLVGDPSSSFQLPQEARNWMSKWDYGQAVVVPLTIVMDLPE